MGLILRDSPYFFHDLPDKYVDYEGLRGRNVEDPERKERCSEGIVALVLKS
jgi:hypothetical protein